MNSELQFFPHPEGYVSVVKFGPETLVINYAYQYKDHLGNIRLNYGKDPETNVLKVLEENHYYLFGLKHQNYNTGRKQYGKKEDEITTLQFPGLVMPTEEKPMVYKYMFGGNEFQDELGLNVYDYDNRIYDQALGRFWQMDPLAEQGRRWSPYNYCFNNPIYFQDPDGMWPKNPFKGLVKAVKETVKSEYREVKRAVKSALHKLEKFENSLGGFDFRSDLKSPSDISDNKQKRNSNGKNVEIVDATGFDVASGISGPKSKGDGKTNATKIVNSAAKDVNEGVGKFKDGMDNFKMFETVKDISETTMSKSNTPEDNVEYVVEGYSTKNKEMRAFNNMNPVGKKNAEKTKQQMLTLPEIDSVTIKRKY